MSSLAEEELTRSRSDGQAEEPWDLLQRVSVRAVVHCRSVAKSCPTICDPLDGSTPGFPVLHYLLEFVQTQVHWLGPLWAKWRLCFLICWQWHYGFLRSYHRVDKRKSDSIVLKQNHRISFAENKDSDTSKKKNNLKALGPKLALSS